MKFRAVFRYELQYRLRHPVTWFFFAVMYIGPVLIVHLSEVDRFRVVNAPLRYATIAAILGIVSMVITAGIFGDAATRDAESRMQSLFGTAPISTWDYLAGRFAASYLVNAVMLLGVPIGVALSSQAPWLAHWNWTPFQFLAYLQPLLLFTLPNLFIAAAVAYTIAALTKNQLAMYLGCVALFILYVMVVNQGLGSDTVENLVDPFAVGALQRIASYWTPSEQLTRRIGFPPILLLNRAVWLGLATAALAFLYSRFSLASEPKRLRLRRGRGRIVAPSDASADLRGDPRHAIASVPKAHRDFGRSGRLAQLLEEIRHSFASITRNRLFLAMALGALVLAFAVGWEVGAVVFDTTTWPVTHLIAGSLHGILISVAMAAVIALVAGELVWKEREVGVAAIAAAAPVPDWLPLLARFIALMGLVVALQLLFALSGVAIQALQGYYRFEPGLYVKMMFGTQLLHYAIVAALALAIHVVVNHKNLGHVLTIATYLFTLVAGPLFGIHHNLLVYNGDPGLVYSDLSGFGPFLRPWLWFKAYWASWALLLGVVATVFWVRSSEGGLRARARLARQRLDGNAGRAGALGGLLIVVLGGFVFYNTNVRNPYVSEGEGIARRVAYERKYKAHAALPQPTLVKADLRVELYPEREELDVRGAFHLVNRTTRPIDTLLVSWHSAVRPGLLDVPGRGAAAASRDEDLRQRVFALAAPILPGDSAQLRFEVSFRRRGFPNQGIVTDVVSNGTYFEQDWLPAIGYQEGRELTDPEQRRENGLPVRAALPAPSDSGAAARERMASREPPVQLDVVFGTSADQIAMTPGRLVREWREGDRRYFHYATTRPIATSIPFLSARYAVARDAWNGVPLSVLYHPGHGFNVARMLQSMKASLGYFSANFGPYVFDELRVVEFPRYGSFARANAHTITFSEGSAFITRIDEDDIDRTFFVVAHETSHQWWGNAVRGAQMKGAAFVSETLAMYSAMMVMEQTFGRDMVWRFFSHEMDRYLRGRQSYDGNEVPLSHASTEAHLYYSKGAVAMYTLRDLIGDTAVNRALGTFYRKYAGDAGPFPTSLDLIAELRAVTPDSLQSHVTDLFETITLWDIKTDTASAVALPNGRWRVTMGITARKLRADTLGEESEVPVNDLIDVGVFRPDSANDTRGDTLYLGFHRLRSGKQSISVEVSHPPGRAGADPFSKLLQRTWRPRPPEVGISKQ